MKKQTDADLQQDYLDAMEIASRHMTPHQPAQAVEFFSKWAVELSQKSGIEFAELHAIALLHLCGLQQAADAERTRQEAIAILDQFGASGSKLNIQDRLADVLIDIGEYRRAIRPCEQALRLSRGANAKVANRLWRAGRNYLRAGFKENAEEPLRKAIEFFREQKDDPRTPVILIDVGNALRASNPEQAEKIYREAAAIWEAKNAHSQASTAWVNLGVLCAEQGRLQDALQWYEKARRVRQADAATPRARLGSLANNIPNVHRRTKDFAQAVREVENAIVLLEGDALLPEAYGTYGLILRDQGMDQASIEWFRKSRAEHARQPSPNAAQLSDVLANEAAALARLGRDREARALEEELARLRGDVPPVQQYQAVPVTAKTSGDAEGAVLVSLDGIHLPEDVYRDCDLATLENRLEEVLGDEGELDGHETGPNTTTVFLYGPDAEALFGAVEPVLRDYPLCRGARVIIRQGDRERHTVLS